MNQPAGTPGFFAGNSKFITRKLWGIANQHPFGHHGLYPTMREAVLAHAGEAQASSRAFRALTKYDQDSVIEFLKSLQILTPPRRGDDDTLGVLRSSGSLCVDDEGREINCPLEITP
jgi:hypothetical protein